MCMRDGCDEWASVYAETHHTARIPKCCCECFRDISAGERYLKIFMVFEHRATSYPMCRHCEAVRSWLTVKCGGTVTEGMLEDFEEHQREGEGDRYVRIAISGMRKKWKGLEPMRPYRMRNTG